MNEIDSSWELAFQKSLKNRKRYDDFITRNGKAIQEFPAYIMKMTKTQREALLGANIDLLKSKRPDEVVGLIDKEVSLDWYLFEKACKMSIGNTILIKTDEVSTYYNKNELKILKENIEKAKKYGIKNIEFQEGFSVEQAEIASGKLENLINEINNTKINERSLTPFEKFVMAYNIATNFKYTAEAEEENPMLSRNINYVLSGDKIVCVGFASLLKCLCDGIGIHCELIHSNTTDYNGHTRCLVKIEDKKYKLNNMFLSDPTFDCVKTYEMFGKTIDTNTLNYILFPLDYKMENEDIYIPKEIEEEYKNSKDTNKEASAETLLKAQTFLLDTKSSHKKTFEQLQNTIFMTQYNAKGFGCYMAPDKNNYMDILASDRYQKLSEKENEIE